MKTLLSIKCTVYNHEPYLRQCLDGFVMQKTNFPFEAIVHDDASTDKSADIILEYAEKYPNIIKPIFEEENLYSKDKRIIHQKIDAAMSSSSKYIALCEGDDYWTDPHKLQKQVDFLEAHPECTMVCNRTKRYSEKNKCFVEDSFCMEKDGFLDTKDIIRKGGLYISTCSITYRISILENYPEYCKQCHVGDYPLQIMAAMKGEIYYINDAMSVYRVENSNSWVGRQNYLCGFEKRKNGVVSEIRMLEGFASQFPEKRKWLYQRIARFINMEFSKWKHDSNAIVKLRKAYNNEINNYSLLWKVDLFFINMNGGLFKRLYMAIAWRTFYKLYRP